MIEWLVGSVSALLVLGIIAFLAYEALWGDKRPPDLVATIERLVEIDSGTLVVVALSNRGDQAAAQVGVEATIGDADGRRKEIWFDYVAAHAVRLGAFVIEGKRVDPASVHLAVHGYVEP